ncbi:hypothetical protein [Gordonia sp. NPDC058843]|uniref:hypothetical protein n=1 Tax=Gordonia sp. NPDC058843 TaxID=3346648 RepID=UPI0036BAB493
MRRIVCGLVGVAALGVIAGCAEERAAAPETVTSTVTATQTTSTSTAPSPSGAAYSSASSVEASVDVEAIRSVKLEYFSGDKVGDKLFQLNRRGGTSFPGVSWTSRSEDGDLESDECAVVIDVTGPGDVDERYRSDECSGGRNSIQMPSITVPGDYRVTVSVTPPGGGQPIVATETIKVIGVGQ